MRETSDCFYHDLNEPISAHFLHFNGSILAEEAAQPNQTQLTQHIEVSKQSPALRMLAVVVLYSMKLHVKTTRPLVCACIQFYCAFANPNILGLHIWCLHPGWSWRKFDYRCTGILDKCQLPNERKAEYWAAINPIFSVTRSFRNHSNILIWCSRNISYNCWNSCAS